MKAPFAPRPPPARSPRPPPGPPGPPPPPRPPKPPPPGPPPPGPPPAKPPPPGPPPRPPGPPPRPPGPAPRPAGPAASAPGVPGSPNPPGSNPPRPNPPKSRMSWPVVCNPALKLPFTRNDSLELSEETGGGSGEAVALTSVLSTCAWFRSKARARSRRLRVKSLFVPVALTLTSLRTGSKPNMLTSTFHRPAVVPSTRNAPFSSVTVSRIRSPCVAFTVAPGMAWPSALTIPV